jgi:hypothetical protein
MSSAQLAELKGIEFELGSFAGGVNVRDALNSLAPDELRKGENIILDERGAGAKRLGCISQGTFGVGADRIISSYTFYRTGAVPQVLIHTSAGKLYYTNDPSANPITWVQITTGLSTSVPMGFETFNGKCYMGDGVSNYASWDGTTYTTFASAPKGRLLRVWKDTMWISGIPGTPDRTYSSDPGDAETFGVSSWVDMGKGDGDSSIALATDGTFLIFSKREKIYVMYDPVTFANRIADAEKGSESHNSWIHFDAQMYFVSRRGICQWRGDAPAIPISLKVDPIFRPDILNINALTNSWGYAYENRVGWALPEVGQTIPTLQLEYYPRLVQKAGQPGPFMFQRLPASVFVRVRSGTSEVLYAAHNTTNKMLWVFAPNGTDDGTTIQALLETGMFDLGHPAKSKYVRRLRFLGRGKFQVQILRNFQASAAFFYTVDLSAVADTWSVGDSWGVGQWGPEAIVKEKLINTDIYCRHVAFRFVDAETNIGSQPLPVGSRDYAISAGEWAVFGVLVDGTVLGVRE